jgi:hypothetical protein
MFATPQAAPPESLARLSPRAIVKRLRPIRLVTINHYLGHYARLITALNLLERHFPYAVENAAMVVKVDPKGETGLGWWEVLAKVVNLAADRNWFAINWEALNEGWAWWVEQGDNGDHLAVFLTYIPVKLYGFVGEALFECPPMELLHVLLAPATEVNAVSIPLLEQARIDEELDEIWLEADRQRAWALLDTIENNPDQYPEAVRWLPELARWACRRTGNVILDRQFSPYRDGPWFGWDELPEVQRAWQRAEPVIHALDWVQTWAEADPANLAALARFLMRGSSTEPLNW